MIDEKLAAVLLWERLEQCLGSFIFEIVLDDGRLIQIKVECPDEH